MKNNVEGYEKLQDALTGAYDQAASGKGKERHACGESFDNQQICEIAKRVKEGGIVSGPLYQAVKKCYESCRLLNEKGEEAAIRELNGAINYICAAIILIKESPEQTKLANFKKKCLETAFDE